jgi:hypothetical protein
LVPVISMFVSTNTEGSDVRARQQTAVVENLSVGMDAGMR